MEGNMGTAKRIYAKVDPDEVPVIEHWITLPDAAVVLGYTRQQAYNLAAAGTFKTLRKISDRSRPQYVLKKSELEVVLKHLTASRTKRATAQLGDPDT